MRIAAWLIAFAGCTTIDDGYALEIHARDAPVVVVKDGDGPWERVATTPDGLAYIQIHETSYGVGALCGSELWRTASFRFDTQPRTVYLPCPVTNDPTHLRVMGTTAAHAMVWIDSKSKRADANGNFDIELFETGLHDVVAILPTTPPSIVARRQIAITGDTRVDLPAGEAVEMEAIYPRVVGAFGDIELSSDVNTDTDWISFGSNPSTVYMPPSDFFLASDRPAVSVKSGGCSRQHPLSAANEPFQLPSPITYSLDRSQITWTADPTVAWDTALVWVTTYGPDYSDYDASVSASWREVTGSSSIPIVDLPSLPGWSGGLARIVPDQQVSMRFYMSRGARDGDFTACAASEEVDRW